MTTTFDVLVVGGGYSGCAVLLHLLRGADEKRPLRLGIVEKTGEFGAGAAYGTKVPGHILNVPANNMGAFADDPGHFYAWLLQNGLDYKPQDFVPRQLYRNYLQDLLAATREGRSTHTIELIDGEVRSVVQQKSGLWECQFASGETRAAKVSVLALGPEAAPWPFAVPQADPRLFQSSWRQDIPWVKMTGNVGILGTGLTALDCVVDAYDSGFKGELILISRRGLLPRQHAEAFHHHLAVPNVLNASKIREALREFRLAAKNAGGDWIAVMHTVRPHVAAIWQALSLKEKKRALCHLRPYWEIHRHRVPPQVMAKVKELQYEGRLRVVKARIRSLDATGTQLQARHLSLDYLINCSGFSDTAAMKQSGLLKNLLEAGIAKSDELGLGIVVNENLEVKKGLFALGSLLRGTLWETTSVPDLRTQAAKIARASHGLL